MFRDILNLNSTSPKQQNQTISIDVPGLNITVNPESSDASSKSEKINITAFETQRDQLFNIDGIY